MQQPSHGAVAAETAHRQWAERWLGVECEAVGQTEHHLDRLGEVRTPANSRQFLRRQHGVHGVLIGIVRAQMIHAGQSEFVAVTAAAAVRAGQVDELDRQLAAAAEHPQQIAERLRGKIERCRAAVSASTFSRAALSPALSPAPSPAIVPAVCSERAPRLSLGCCGLQTEERLEQRAAGIEAANEALVAVCRAGCSAAVADDRATVRKGPLRLRV